MYSGEPKTIEMNNINSRQNRFSRRDYNVRGVRTQYITLQEKEE